MEPTAAIKIPKLHPAQALVVREAKRFNALACGRRWGKSTLGINLALRTAASGDPAGWFAASYKLLADAWREMTAVIGDAADINKNERYISFPGGGSIEAWSLDTPSPARSRKYKIVIIDEAAHAPELQHQWELCIRPCLADLHGSAWFCSTPKGLNAFHTYWLRGQDPEREDWASWQMPTRSNPYIAAEEIEAARRDMTEGWFNQEFLALFQDWEGAVFRHVTQCATAKRKDGPEPGRDYVFGVDWGKSSDFSVFVVLDVAARAMVDFQRSNQVDYTLQRARLRALYERWRPLQIIAEKNSIGDPICEDLIRDGLPVKLFTTSNASKAEAIEALALAFEQGSIAILDEPVLLGELQAFAAERLPSGLMRYGAPGGQHDDTVMALAIAFSVIRDDSRCYGLTAYLDAKEKELEAEHQQRMQATAQRLALAGLGLIKNAGWQSGRPTGMVCPECSATCIAPVSSGGCRCSACGHQWSPGAPAAVPDGNRHGAVTPFSDMSGVTRRFW
jgi:hypothetical protein